MTEHLGPIIPALKLCYVSEPWAWFTSLPLDEQWGDDWNDAPYEHNAGDPYAWREGCGRAPYTLVKVAFDGPLEAPDEYERNSPWSVQAINARQVPWLKTDRFAHSVPDVKIWAGDSPKMFRHLVASVNGRTYHCEGS